MGFGKWGTEGGTAANRKTAMKRVKRAPRAFTTKPRQGGVKDGQEQWTGRSKCKQNKKRDQFRRGVQGDFPGEASVEWGVLSVQRSVRDMAEEVGQAIS